MLKNKHTRRVVVGLAAVMVGSFASYADIDLSGAPSGEDVLDSVDSTISTAGAMVGTLIQVAGLIFAFLGVTGFIRVAKDESDRETYTKPSIFLVAGICLVIFPTIIGVGANTLLGGGPANQAGQIQKTDF